jgi:hypothetical protein
MSPAIVRLGVDTLCWHMRLEAGEMGSNLSLPVEILE